MKKVLLSVLTLLYMTVSSGVAIEIHYCMGKKAGIDFYKAERNPACGKCGMKGSKSGCCHNEHRFYKLADAHKILVSESCSDAPIALPPESSIYPQAGHRNIWFFREYFSNSPPYEKPAIWLRVCNFRI